MGKRTNNMDFTALEGQYIVVEDAGTDHESFIGAYRDVIQARKEAARVEGGDIMKVVGGMLTTEF